MATKSLIMLLSKAKLGKLRGNTHANPGNLVKLAADWCCDATTAPTCEDTYSGAVNNARTLASVTIELPDATLVVVPTTLPIKQANGKVVADTYGLIPVTNPARMQDFIWRALSLFEFDIKVEIGYESGTLTVQHIGKTKLKTLTFDNASTVSPTRCCTSVMLQVFKLSVVGVVGDLAYGGDTADLAGNPYDYSGIALADEATAVELQNDVTTALNSLSGYTFERVEVSVANAAGGYTIKVFTTNSTPVVFGDTPMAYCELSEEFIC